MNLYYINGVMVSEKEFRSMLTKDLRESHREDKCDNIVKMLMRQRFRTLTINGNRYKIGYEA